MTNRFGILGVLALIVYFALFSAGIVIDSGAYRARVTGGGAPASAAGVGPAAGVLPPVSAPPASPGDLDWMALGAFALTYTPLNVGILCILAGLIGGCASRITYARPDAPAGVELPGGAWFKTESPFASMLRSFLVYIAIVAGVSISTDGAFATTSSEGYVRFAATVSFFAFVVGYDPTKFGEWINRSPTGGGAKS